MVVCPECNRENPDYKLFCAACGANLAHLKIEDRSVEIREELHTRADDGTRSPRYTSSGDKERITWQSLLNSFFGVLSIALTKYVGALIVLPALMIAFIQWAGMKVMEDTKRPIIPPFAIQAGHLAWQIIGITYLALNSYSIASGLFEILYVLTGLVWLMLKPDLGPMIMLGIFQGCRIVDHIILLSSVERGTDLHKTLFTHMALRGLALFSMAQAYVKMRKASQESPQP
jgi:hypothetical protein